MWGALFLLALCGACFFLSLGGLPLSGPDEPRYAEVGREMFASGDWVTPRLAGYLWFEKPTLLYWGQAVSYHLFGVNEWAARFPSALAATLTVLYLAYALRRLGFVRWGFLAGVTLATSAIWFVLARAASTDMVLSWAIGSAVLAGYLAFNTAGKERVWHWLAFSVALGASMLAKGLIGIVLICGILGVHRLLMRQSLGAALRRNAGLVAVGALVFLAVSALWYGPVWTRNGMTFFHEFIVRHHFERFTSNEFHHPEPFWFYFFIALVGVTPWLFWLPASLARLKHLRARDDERGALLLLAWVWAAIPVAFFTLSGSKLPAYVLPIFPALAILISAELERVWRGQLDLWSQIGLAQTAFVAAGVGLAFGYFAWREGVALSGFNLSVMALPLLLGLFTLIAWALKRQKLAIGGTVGLVLGLIVSAIVLLFPVVGPQKSKREISLAAAAALKPGENIVFYRKQKEYAPVFYAQGRTLFYRQVMDAKGEPIRGKSTLLPPGTLSTGDKIDALTPGELELALESSPTREVVVITQVPGATELAADPGLHTELISKEGKVMALRVRRLGG